MKKIQFFLTFILVLTACTSPESQATITSPTPIPTTGVDPKPVGFGSTPDLASSINQFAPPLKEDFRYYSQREAVIPESIKSEVERYKTEMTKYVAEVADICVVDANSLKPVFKSNGLTGNDYRWTVVYESSADNATCWSSVLSTGAMGEYPTYFYEEDGAIKVFSKNKGGGWERMDNAIMDFADTQPVVLFENGYLQPQGHTLGEMYGYILDYGEAPEFVVPMDSPFSVNDMTLIKNAGWHWENSTATLNDPNNNEVLQYLGTTLRDSQGNKMEVSDVKFLEVNGVDEKGTPMKLILERTVKDEQGEHTEIFVQKTNEWRSTLGYEPGSTSDTDIMQWSHITKEDVESGFLRTLVLSNQYKWPENSVVPVYTYAFMGGSRDGAFKLTVSGMDSLREYPELSEGGQLAISQPLMYRMDQPGSTDQVAIAVELRKSPSGADLALFSAISSYYVPGSALDNEFGINGNSTGITYLVGLDDRDCSQADLGKGSASGSRLVSSICGFMPPQDPRWDFATWDSIANGGEPGSVYESAPLTDKDLSMWQDSIMIGLGKFD